MSLRLNVWAVCPLKPSGEITYQDCQNYGYSKRIGEARLTARLGSAEAVVYDESQKRFGIYKATFSFSRRYLVDAMNTYEGFVEPVNYELKEVIEVSEEEAEAIFKQHGLKEER